MAKGAKTGGRKRGSKNKVTLEREAGLAEVVARASTEGLTPLEIMVGAMRDAWDRNDKDAAARFARDAAPYIHPRLQAIEHSGPNGKDLIPQVPAKDVARAIFEIFREARGSSE